MKARASSRTPHGVRLVLSGAEGRLAAALLCLGLPGARGTRRLPFGLNEASGQKNPSRACDTRVNCLRFLPLSP
jgi:hypothetical protein